MKHIEVVSFIKDDRSRQKRGLRPEANDAQSEDFISPIFWTTDQHHTS